MARHTSRQRDVDDTAFPMRVKVAIPPEGLGRELDRVAAWVCDNLSLGGYAKHRAPT